MRNTGARRDCLGGRVPGGNGEPRKPEGAAPKSATLSFRFHPLRSLQFRYVPRMAARAPHERRVRGTCA
eukprot:3717577-Prymnesium_polylepis.1